MTTNNIIPMAVPFKQNGKICLDLTKLTNP